MRERSGKYPDAAPDGADAELRKFPRDECATPGCGAKPAPIECLRAVGSVGWFSFAAAPPGGPSSVEVSAEAARLLDSEPAGGPDLEAILARFDDDSRPRVAAALERTLGTGERASLDARVVRRDGSARWVRLDLERQPGSPPRAVGVLVGVEAGPGALAPVQEVERRYEQVLDAISDFVFVKGPDGRYVWMNCALREFFGVRQGQPLDALRPPTDDPDSSHAIDRRVFETGKPVLVEKERIRGARGTERFVQTAKSPILDASGHVSHVVGVARDLSTDLAREAALRASEERLRQVAENVGQVFWMVDARTHRTEYVSPAYERIYGRRVADAFADSRSWLESVVPEDRPHVVAALPRAIEGHYDVRYRIRRPDGSERWIHDRAFPVREGGEVVRIAGIAEDVTDLVRLEHALERRARQQEIVADLGQQALVATDLGKLMDDVLRVIDEALGLPRGAVVVDSEDGARHRVVRIRGLPADLLGTTVVGLPVAGGDAADTPAACEDATEDVRLATVSRLRAIGARSGIAVPIRGKSHPLGTLVVGTEEARRYSSDEVHFLSSVAHVLGAAIARGRSEEELRQREDQIRIRAVQQEAVAKLGQRALGAADLDALMDEALAVLSATLRVPVAVVLELAAVGAAGMLSFRRSVGVPPRFAEARYPMGRASPSGYAVVMDEAVVYEDARRESRFERSPLMVELGLVSGMAVPIRCKAGTFGALSVASEKVRLATKDDVNFVTAVANVLGAAIDRRRDEDALRLGEEAVRVRARQQAAVAHVSQRALGETHVGALFGDALRSLTSTLGVEMGVVIEVAADRSELRYVAGEGFEPSVLGRTVPLGPAGSPAAHAYEAEGPIVFEDMDRETRFPRTSVMTENGCASGINVPIRTKGRPFGILGVLSKRPRAYSQDDVHFVVAVANVLAAALDRRRAAEALQRSEDRFRHAQKLEAIGRLAGGVAHDFNNLLTAILGYSDLAIEATPVEGLLGRSLSEIRKAGERAKVLTRQLLTFSRREPMSPRVIDLSVLVKDLGPMLRRLIGEDVELAIERAAEPVLVSADPGQIEQIILNLVVNARDAMPHGGRITITTALAEGSGSPAPGELPRRFARLSIADDGTGMDEATRAHLFEPFFTTKEQGKGTGLGLSTVYGIVQQAKGRIEVETKLGKGSVFHVHLPETDVGLAATVLATAGPACGGRERILLVEDEELVRTLAASILRSRGYDVVEARDGAEALSVHDSAPRFDLVVSDVVMPRLGGFELARRLRERAPSLPILFISGYTGGLGGGLPADAVLLEKPFTPDALAVRVRERLDAAARATPRPPAS